MATKSFEQLDLKERMAIELRYLGNTLKETAEKTNVSFDTIVGWFAKDGKLYTIYNDYVVEMNNKRQAEFEKRITVSDEEFFILTTNIVRKLAQKVKGIKKPLLDKKGRAVLDDDGRPIWIDEEIELGVGDLERVWKMQRVMQNLPTSYEKQDIHQKNFEADLIIKELGLGPVDFEDKNIDATTNKITRYLLKGDRGSESGGGSETDGEEGTVEE